VVAVVDVDHFKAYNDAYDQIVPIDIASRQAIKLLKHGTLNVHAGAPHGLVGQFEQDFNAELLAFIKS
jgi:non-heme chloroperoxidase